MPVLVYASIALLALFGADSWRDWFEDRFSRLWDLWEEKIERRVEQKTDDRLRDDGVLNPDGTVTVDREFDADLNSVERELDSELREAERELDGLELGE